jgi:hypothetical protein
LLVCAPAVRQEATKEIANNSMLTEVIVVYGLLGTKVQNKIENEEMKE